MLRTLGETPFELITADSSGHFAIGPTARQILQSVGTTSITVVGVIGPFKKGKTHLMNEFMDSGESDKPVQRFQSSNDIRGCTRGVWAWGRFNEQMNKLTIALDSEGLSDHDKHDPVFDMKLMWVVTSLCSVVVYNHFSVINTEMITKLGQCLNFAGIDRSLDQEHSEGLSDVTASGKKAASLTRSEPVLVLVLRDFSLTLSGTANEYLQRALIGRPHELNMTSNEGKRIADFFATCDCVCLGHPGVNNLADDTPVANATLFKAFQRAMRDLVELLRRHAENKSIASSGEEFYNLIESTLLVVNGFNDGDSIAESLKDARTAQHVARVALEGYVSDIQCIHLPEYPDILLRKHQEADNRAVDELRKILLDRDRQYVQMAEKFLQQAIREEFAAIKAKNTELELELFNKLIAQVKSYTLREARMANIPWLSVDVGFCTANMTREHKAKASEVLSSRLAFLEEEDNRKRLMEMRELGKRKQREQEELLAKQQAQAKRRRLEEEAVQRARQARLERDRREAAARQAEETRQRELRLAQERARREAEARQRQEDERRRLED
ncbi:Guanylate-binding protein 4 [Rhizophlyctis rosea]|nr:Guanylate-binding protein 4 [Rhizophlyctis rosea]